MEKKIFGPTIFSFISYLGVNVILILSPIALLFIKELRIFAIFLLVLWTVVIFPPIFFVACWVILDEVGIKVVSYAGNQKIEWNKIEKIICENIHSYRRAFISVTTGFTLCSKSGREVSVSTTMWPDNANDIFFQLLLEKSHTFGFKIFKSRREEFNAPVA